MDTQITLFTLLYTFFPLLFSVLASVTPLIFILCSFMSLPPPPTPPNFSFGSFPCLVYLSFIEFHCVYYCITMYHFESYHNMYDSIVWHCKILCCMYLLISVSDYELLDCTIMCGIIQCKKIKKSQ